MLLLSLLSTAGPVLADPPEGRAKTVSLPLADSPSPDRASGATMPAPRSTITIWHNYPIGNPTLTYNGSVQTLPAPVIVNAYTTQYILAAGSLPAGPVLVRMQAQEKSQPGVNLRYALGINEVQY